MRLLQLSWIVVWAWIPAEVCAQVEESWNSASKTLKGRAGSNELSEVALALAANPVRERDTEPTESSTSESSEPLSQPTTTILVVISYPSSTVTSSSSGSSSATTQVSSISTIVPILSSTSTSISSDPEFTPTSSSSSNQSSWPVRHRNLIIILSSVLGSVGLVLIALTICLACRHRRGGASFRQGGATPIDDEEIDSWRNTMEQKRPIVDGLPTSPKSPHTPRGASIDSIALQHSPNWTWSPQTHTRNSHSRNSHSFHSPTYMVQQAPDFFARAPNSRAGLTDEAIPGADPFIGPVKRQSSRLSKAPPGHGRSKSRRSSMSAKSMWSYNGPITELSAPKPTVTRDPMPMWFDPDDESVSTRLRNDGSSSPGTSIFDLDGFTTGGLSPRPKSKSTPRAWSHSQQWGRETAEEIGRAIA